MTQIKENLPLFVYFLIQFSDWKVKAAEGFYMLNSFPFKKRSVLENTLPPPTLFLLSHSVFWRMSQISRGITYTYLFSVLKLEKTLSIFQGSFLTSYVSIKFAHCLFPVYGCQPSVP